LSFGVFVNEVRHGKPEEGEAQPAPRLGEEVAVRVFASRYAVIMDSGAQVSVFKDKSLLTDVRHAPSPISMTGITGGAVSVGTIGTFGSFGDVYYSPDVSANTLSLSHVRKAFETTLSPAGFVVSFPDGDVLFAENAGHYVAHFPPVASSVLVSTVAEREGLYSKREVAEAQKARAYQQILGFPSQKDFLKMIQSGAIQGMDFTYRDALRAMDIYGPSEAELKGKTKAQQAKTITAEYVPRPLRSHINLHADLFFVEGEAYLLTVSMPLGMLMMSHLGTSRSGPVLLRAIKSQLDTYRLENFTVDTILVDGEGGLKKIKDSIVAFGVRVDATGAGEHVPLAEVYIRVVKERVRCVLHSLPYSLPSILLKWQSRHQFKVMPMPEEAISKNFLAAKGKSIPKEPTFERSDKVAIGEVELEEEPFVAAGRIFPPNEPLKLVGDGRGDEIVSDPTADGLEPVELPTDECDGEDESDPAPFYDQQAAESLAALYVVRERSCAIL
jgi:hypothetical protein